MILHPDVIAFWEKKGCTVESRFDMEIWHDNLLWDAVKNNAIEYTIGITFLTDRPDIYYWNGEEYSEAEILRVLKMKAFA
jgi:hypothetical protein